MASNLTRQWLLQQQKQPAVHKWEKRWVQKGKLMIFKWVKTDQKSGGNSGKPEEMEDDSQMDAEVMGETGLQPRRLTRGKAADMGITVESETLGDPEALTRSQGPAVQRLEKKREMPDGTTPNFPSAVGTPFTPADLNSKAEDPAQAESRKRPRDSEETDPSEETSLKKSRAEEQVRQESDANGPSGNQGGGTGQSDEVANAGDTSAQAPEATAGGQSTEALAAGPSAE